MSVGIISIAAFLFVTALVGGIAMLTRDFGKTSQEERLELLTGKRREEADGENLMKGDLLKDTADGASSMFGKISRGFTGLSMYLEQANCPLRPDQFLILVLGCMGAGVLVGFVMRFPAPLYPVFGLIVGSFPWIWVWWTRGCRFKAFARQLPDSMGMIARALRSGHSLASAMNVIVEEMPQPIALEFSMAYEEQNLGIPIDKALKSMLKRMPNLDLKFFVTAVAIQKQSGGDLAEILDKIAHIIRERFKILGLVAALTAEGRLSGIVLMALPLGLFAAVYTLNQEYVSLLFTDPLGRKMVMGAVFMQIIGAFVIKKIIDIKV